ncbi:MAG: RimJ/RimL family protein N-acetyltransferase [Polaribacter sp.]|jgi:RimJ/RimL family protein N-acetyltransferase
MNKSLIQTERLGLRNWTEADITAMIAISSDPLVMEYFPATATPEQTTSFSKRMQEMCDLRKYCYFAVEELATQEMIGFIGLCYQDYEARFTPCVDIGWRLKPSAWGKGYATEGAKACLDYARETLALTEIYSVAVKINTPSIKVMEKIGMDYVETFVHPKLKDNERLRDCVLYRKVF